MNDLIAQILERGAKSVMIRQFDHGHMLGVGLEMKDGTRHAVPCETYVEGLRELICWLDMRRFYKDTKWVAEQAQAKRVVKLVPKAG